MNIIEFEKWKSSSDDPRRLEYAGQRVAAEVFAELKHRLEGMGYLPDEYFLMATEWENGRKIPKDADVFCTTDYGGSEGVYLDVYLKWPENGKPVTKSFITGKTLGENGNDLDRMFLISSAITKAFHGDRATHTRYMKIGGVEDDLGGSVVHLSQREQRTIIEALVEQRERQEEAMSQTEQLLRRMTGSISSGQSPLHAKRPSGIPHCAPLPLLSPQSLKGGFVGAPFYMDTVGQRPLRMSDYDKAVLAVRDGEFQKFTELWPKVKDRGEGLLPEVAGRPGEVGQKMTALALSGEQKFSAEVYRAACQRAIDINSLARVELLLNATDSHAEGLEPSFPGEMASYAYLEHRAIAKEIIEQCTNEQIAAAPSSLLEAFAADSDFRTMSTLVEKGISMNSAWRTMHMLTHNANDHWMAEELLEKRMWVNPEDYGALQACVENGAVEVAKLLLNGGMDFEKFRQRYPACGSEETIQALEEHWQELKGQGESQDQEQSEGPEIGGMTFG